MNDNPTPKKKKKALRRELILGGGLMALFSPVILLALFWTVIAVGYGVILINGVHTDTQVFWTMLAVYGTLLLIFVITGYKFSARLIAVIQRMLNIRREQRRVQAEFALLQDHEPVVDDAEDGYQAGQQRRDLI